MKQFVSGAILMGYWVVALFFLRFWVKTKDRFFAFFATSFLILGMERLFLVLMDVSHEARSLVHLVRLAAFLLILVAVVDKNRSGQGAD